jgi:cleavage and polyadenylation specificity factor subunit 3
MNAVDVKLASEQEIVLEWVSGSSSDMIADAAVALILGIDRSPASVKCMCITLRYTLLI